MNTIRRSNGPTGSRLRRGVARFLAALLLLPLVSLAAAAQETYLPGMPGVLEIDGEFAAALILDDETGEILAGKDPHGQRQPASMVKMMTELLVLEHIAAGELSLDDTVRVSAHASRMGGSQVYLKEGERFAVEDLLQALAIHSANDAAAALAEYHSGSVEAFVDLMNMRASELNLQDTAFHSVHGLPPGSRQEPDLSSAHDMAILGRELMRHPEAVRWASTATAPFRDGEFTLYNPNQLVGRYRGLDGIKTGHHSQAGFCITVSAVQKGRRIIASVLGAPSEEARQTEATRLLSFGFNLFTQVALVEGAHQPLPEPLEVKGGKRRTVQAGYAEPLTVSVRRDRANTVFLDAQLPEKIPAPIAVGDVLGHAVAVVDGRAIGQVAIIALETVDRGSFLQRIFH